MADERGFYIGGEWHPAVDPNVPVPTAPSASAELDAALVRLKEKRGEQTERAEHVERDHSRSFAGADEAHRHVLGKRARAEGERELMEDAAARTAAEDAQRDIAATASWSGEDEQVLGVISQRAQQFQRDSARFVEAQALMQRDAARATPQNRQALAVEAQRLQAERAELQQAALKVNQTAAVKSAAAQKKQLYREIPELADPENRRALVEWAKSKGIPAKVALSERDPVVVSRAWAQFQQEQHAERQRHLDRLRAPIHRTGPLAPGGPMPEAMTVEQARDRLKRTGSMSDALNYLVLAGERKKEAQE